MSRKSMITPRLKTFFKSAAEFTKAKGLYIILFACLTLVGVVAVFAFTGETDDGAGAKKSTGDGMSAIAQPTPTMSIFAASHSDDERLSALASPTPIADFTQPPATAKAAEIKKVAAPTDGEIIWGYAVNELIFSRTLGQWMTHSGVDIASPKGSEVYAIYGGSVENVIVDDLLGVTVTIAHENGMMSVYANLREEPPVKEGQFVKEHELIGFIGDTAIAECADKSHLHFELYKNSNTVDPCDYIRFDKTKID